ncbi:MAG: TonB-dependent receptor [Flavobacteriales bacterium]|nr:TonB-dependent receptor [Flavobacteriales bacterium]
MKQFTFILIILLSAYASHAQLSFSGRITNENDGKGIANAAVSLTNGNNSYYQLTDENGFYQFTNLASENYRICITHISYDSTCESILVDKNMVYNISLRPANYTTETAIVNVVRANGKNPSVTTYLDKEEIIKTDQGKDFPYLLDMTPSTVISSDAGNGVGYTGVRIRGIDPTRVNVTINGIPLNDAESQGVYWVDLPDLTSSTQNVQVQRGVGTSTNGGAAFGSSINIKTDIVPSQYSKVLNFGFGSFNTQRLSAAYSTGRLKNNWAFLFRGSLIESDGFIDRASSELLSTNLAASKYWKKAVFKANLLFGNERTYQAWWGIPQPKFEQNTPELNRYINQLWITGNDLQNLQQSNSKTYNYYTYENEVDDYNQNHYQLFYDYHFNKKLTFSSAAYTTTGKGFYEQFRPKDDLSFYNLQNQIVGNDTFTTADIIRRRWLKNVLVGGLASLNYNVKKMEASMGLGYNTYFGNHFGEAIATEFTAYEALNSLYYDNNSRKGDGNVYAKLQYKLKHFYPYLDVQYRTISYHFEGFDNQNEAKNYSVNYGFFNPKAGFLFEKRFTQLYAFYARGNREPVRDDFRNSKNGNWPMAEQLDDIETGYKLKRKRTMLGLNVYYMNYKNQLVLTGAINDVGEAIRQNVAKSYRRGIEAEFQCALSKSLQLGGNLTLSQNKIVDFIETIYEWDDDYETFTNTYKNTNISFSPSIISAAQLGYKVNPNFTLNIHSKYVSKQFLDNTQSENRMLPSFHYTDVSINYSTDQFKGIKKTTLSLFFNNIFNQSFAPNGYTFGGILQNQRADFNYVFPMAGFNWMLKIRIEL